MPRLLFAIAVSVCALAAQAQGWLSKAVCLIVPYPPGGSTDVTARALADATVRERLGKAALEPVGGSTAAFARLVRANFEMYRGLVAELKIRVN